VSGQFEHRTTGPVIFASLWSNVISALRSRSLASTKEKGVETWGQLHPK